MIKRFEDAIQHVINGGKARRGCWASQWEYTKATPPISYRRFWRIWSVGSSVAGIVQGWGGQIGFQLAADDLIRDGTLWSPTNEDRIATDWELVERS